MQQENTEGHHREFVEKLETIYGPFEASRNKFEATSNSKIARDLCYSDSQFSRLINNTASEGEFKRALHNVDRLLLERSLAKKQNTSQASQPVPQKSKIIYGLTSLCVLLVVSLLYFTVVEPKPKVEEPSTHSRYDMLEWSFENKYIKPYIKLKELPADCNYPCYKYQGEWKLKNSYKIPFFRERNGFHYVAKDAVLYARCQEEKEAAGTLIEGYEYQLHEIWYDKRELPIDSFLMKNQSTRLRQEYNEKDLASSPHFVKLANVHTFFRNEFSIDSILINRSGKTIGRDIEFLSDEALGEALGTTKLVEDLKAEVNSIAKNRLEDFSKPVECSPSPVPKSNFNYVEEGDELRFKCQFTTGRFLVDYEKIFVLDNQYINNRCL